MRLGNVTGSENAPLPAFASPLPSITEPCQSTSTCRSIVAIRPPGNCRVQIAGCRLHCRVHFRVHVHSAHLRLRPVTLNCTTVPITPRAIHPMVNHCCDSAGVVGYKIQTPPPTPPAFAAS